MILPKHLFSGGEVSHFIKTRSSTWSGFVFVVHFSQTCSSENQLLGPPNPKMLLYLLSGKLGSGTFIMGRSLIKCHGVNAERSSGSKVKGVRRLNFKIASISVRIIYNSSKVNLAFSSFLSRFP